MQNTKFATERVETYKDLNLDDNSWLEINAPKSWDKQALGEFNGVVWLKKRFLLSKDDLKNDIILEISGIDDEDIS